MQSNRTKLVYDNFPNKTSNSNFKKNVLITVIQISPSFESKWGGIKISIQI